MATPKPINTRILLRNDTLANWGSSTLTLGKGEVAIATGLDGNLVEVRVGNGTTTWSGAAKLAVDASQISGIVQLIQGTAKKYQIVANGNTTNSWKLQSEPLSATTDEWVDVSTFTVELSDYYTKDEVNTISAALSSGLLGTDTDTSSANTIYGAKAYADEVANAAETAAKTYADNLCAELSTTTAETYLSTATFNAYKNEVGLSAATTENYVITKKDIASLDKVMHFKGVVNAAPTETTGYKVGDVVLVAGSSVEGDNGKEFVLVNTGTDTQPILKWELIGDQNAISALTEYVDTAIGNLSDAVTADYATKNELTASANALSTDYNGKINALSDAISGITGDYATKTELNNVSVALSTDYDGKIKTVDDKVDGILSDYLKAADKTKLETLVGTTSAETLVSANAYADSKFAGLSDYYTKSEVNAISSALSTDYVGKIATAKSEVIGTTKDLSSADTINGAKKYAKNYTDEAVAGLSADKFIKHGEVVDTDLSGFFILSCGGASLRQDEPPFNA